MDIEKALKDYKDADDAVLSISINASLAADRDWCDGFSDQLNTVAGKWEVINALPESHTIIPDKLGLYMFVWVPLISFRIDAMVWSDFKHVIYVGKSDSLSSSIRKRYRNEYSDYIGHHAEMLWINDESSFNREKYLKKYLSLSKLEFWFLIFEEEFVDRINEYEKRLLNLFKPVANQQDMAKRFSVKFQEPEKAF